MGSDKYINPNNMTDRQKWAAGALAEKFYQMGSLETVSANRDQIARDFLEKSGYQDFEINILLDHMNACAQKAQDMTDGEYFRMVAEIKNSVSEGRHNPPAPK
jgi:hypothetical protein